jgi:hypothetical protein
MKSFKETFEDPFAAASNVERRERGELDFEILPAPQPKYIIMCRISETYYISYDFGFHSVRKHAKRFDCEEEARRELVKFLEKFAVKDRFPLSEYDIVPVTS